MHVEPNFEQRGTYFISALSNSPVHHLNLITFKRVSNETITCFRFPDSLIFILRYIPGEGRNKTDCVRKKNLPNM